MHTNRLGLYSMLTTVAILAGVIWLGSYSVLQPRVEALPATIPFSEQEWMSFIPDSAQFVSYVNYQAAYAASGNYSLFGADPLLEIYSPPFTIYPNSIEYELAINLPGQVAKESGPAVSVIEMQANDATALDSALKSSTVVHKVVHGQHEIFTLLIRHKELQPELVSASVSLIGQHLLLAQETGGESSIAKILDTLDYGQDRLFSQSSARVALYASSGGDNGYLALFIASFPTQIEGAKIIMKTVSTAAGAALSRIAFAFDNQDQARAQYPNVKKLYTGGSDYWILDNFVVATFRNDVSNLLDQIRGL
jgi:hypothetical protein